MQQREQGDEEQPRPSSLVIDLTNEPDEPLGSIDAAPRPLASRQAAPPPTSAKRDCVIYLLDVGVVQAGVFRRRVPEFGGKVSDVLNSSVTQIITSSESYEEAIGKIQARKLIAPEFDEHGERKRIKANFHKVEWLTQSLGSSERLANNVMRLEPKPKVIPDRPPETSLQPALSASQFSGSSDGGVSAVAADAPAPVTDVAPSSSATAAVVVGPVYFVNDRPAPPCLCGLPAQCSAGNNPRASTRGRLQFHCSGAKGCSFFEWVDQPPRNTYFDLYKRHGYEYSKYVNLPRIPYALDQEPEKQRHPGKRLPPDQLDEEENSEGKVLKYVDESQIPSLCKCCICLMPLMDPRTTVCAHNFCRTCIMPWLGGTQTCPECRKPVDVNGLRDPDFTLVRLLDQLEVFCPNNECEWQGERGLLPAHLEQCRKKMRFQVDSSDEGKDPSQGKRAKLDPNAPPSIFRSASNDTGPVLDAAGRVIVANHARVFSRFASCHAPLSLVDGTGRVVVDDQHLVDINIDGLSRLQDVASTDLMLVEAVEVDEDNGGYRSDREDDELEYSDDYLANSPPSPSKVNRDERVFSQFTPPSSDDEHYKFDNEPATDPNFKYISKDEVKIKPYMERRKKSFAAANPNEHERRKDMNHNKELADQLTQVAAMYPQADFRCRAHTIAAAAVSRHPRRIDTVDEARKIHGVGSKILAKIEEFLNFGEMRKIRLKDQASKDRDELRKVHGIGGKVLDKLWTKGIRSLAQLRQNAHMLSHKQQIGLKYVEEFQIRIPRAEVAEIEDAVSRVAHSIDPNLVLVTCGSYRRGKASSGDVDILITHKMHAKVLDIVLKTLVEKLFANGLVTDSLTETKPGADKWMGVCQLRPDLPHRRLDFQLIARESWPFALLYFTGSAHFNRSMRFWAGKNGFSLSQHALVVRPTVKHVSGMYKMEGIVRVKCNTEEDVFGALKLEYLPPHRRDL